MHVKSFNKKLCHKNSKELYNTLDLNILQLAGIIFVFLVIIIVIIGIVLIIVKHLQSYFNNKLYCEEDENVIENVQTV